MAANYQMLFELNAALGGGFASAFTQGSQQIENMKSKLESLNSMGSTGDLLGGISSALSAVGVMQGLQSIYDMLQDCAQASIEFESAMTGVSKTTDLSASELEEMSAAVMRLSTEIPVTTTELANVMEVAGQLGIGKENLLDFSTTMSQLATATTMTADEAATMLAQFANITQMDPSQYSNLASAVVDLGNNYATTEQKIVEMGQGIAASGSLAGMSEADMMGLSAAVTSLGIETAAGSTSMSKLISQINMAVETGNGLDEFASVAGMTASEFATAWGDDAANALATFVTGLNDVERNGASATVILSELGITETRMQRMILSLAGSGDLMANAIRDANSAFAENTALSAEAEKRYATTESRLTMLSNAANNVKISIGDALTPVISSVAEGLTGLLEPMAEFIEQNPAIVQGITAFVAVLGVAAGAVAAYTAATKLAAAANLLFGGSIPGIGIIMGVAAGVGALVAGIGLLSDAIHDANPSFEELDAQFDDLNEKAKEQQAIIDLAEEYKNLTKEIADLESQSTDTTITIDAEPGKTVSVSGDLVVDKDGNVYAIDAETGEIVSVANDLVTDKDGNTYLIDASAGQKVSVKADLVTDKTGNTYVIDAQSGRHVSVRNDLVVDKDGNVFMIDAVTGNKVSVKYDLVTEADGTQYIINAITGQKVKVNTDLVYGNSEDELRQVINAEAGTHVSVSGELVTDKEGNTYVINARTGQKVSVKGDLVTDKDGTVYLIDAQTGKKVSVSNDLVTDQDGKLVKIDGEAGDTVSVYSLITDEEGKNVTITATVNTDGAEEELKALSEAEAASAAAAEELAAKRERLHEVTEALRTASGGLITATDQETDALNRQIGAYEAVARARKDQYTTQALDTITGQTKHYTEAVRAGTQAVTDLNKAQARADVITAFMDSGDAVGYLRDQYEELKYDVDSYEGSNWLIDDNTEAAALRERFIGLQETLNAVSTYNHDLWDTWIDPMENLKYAIDNDVMSEHDMVEGWKYATEQATQYADAVESNSKVQSEYIQNLVNGVTEGTMTTDQLRAALELAFKDAEDGAAQVDAIMEQVEEGINAAKAAAEGSGEVAQTESQGSIEAVTNVITKVEELRQAYENAKAAAKESLNGKFGLFDQAGLSDERQSVDEMGQGLQSQTEYWNQYQSNLEAVLNKGLAPEIAQQLSDGSQASAEALAELATASDEQIQSINESFQALEEQKDSLASVIADMQTNFSTTLASMKTELDTAVAELDMSTEAAQNAAATMTAYVEGLNAEDENASEAAKSIAANVNAALAAITDVDVDITYHYKTEGSPPADASGGTVGAHDAIGTDYAAAGLTLVGEEGPEIVMMQGGEKVLTAHETVNALSGASGDGSNHVDVQFSPVFNVSGSGNAAEIRAMLQEQSESLRDQVENIMDEVLSDRKRTAYA